MLLFSGDYLEKLLLLTKSIPQPCGGEAYDVADLEAAFENLELCLCSPFFCS